MPVVPTPPTIQDEITASSVWNQFRDAIDFLMGKPIAQLRQTSAQTLTTVTYTPVQFQAEAFDDDIDGVGGHDNSTNNTRWTCRYPGHHLISGLVTYAANATGARHAGLRINGIDVSGSYRSLPISSGADVCGIACKTMRVYLAASDYVELIAYQSSGGNLATFVATAAYQSGLAIGWERN